MQACVTIFVIYNCNQRVQFVSSMHEEILELNTIYINFSILVCLHSGILILCIRKKIDSLLQEILCCANTLRRKKVAYFEKCSKGFLKALRCTRSGLASHWFRYLVHILQFGRNALEWCQVQFLSIYFSDYANYYLNLLWPYSI